MTNPDPNRCTDFEYHGPIASINGTRPSNHYLWPTESWWAYRTLGFSYSGTWHFGIVALNDGRFTTDGDVFAIERGRDCYGQRCVYPTRTTAIRAAAAHLIQTALYARHWPRGISDGLTIERCQTLINWIRQTVATETKAQPPTPLTLHIPPPPPEPTGLEGLPLFDHHPTTPPSASEARKEA
jgi:hypothetical protein